jgi:NAD(P)H-flavin reductase
MGKIGKKGVKKVWVCGPPVMTETFDRAFTNLRAADT